MLWVFGLCMKISLRSAYQEYFPGVTPYVSTVFNIAQKNFPDNFYVVNCLFYDMTESSIYMSHSTLPKHMVVEETGFYNCSSNSDGGAIFFQCENGSMVLTKVCGSKCYLRGSNNGLFSYVDGGSSKNMTLKFISIVDIIATIGSYSIYFGTSIIYYDMNNLSNIRAHNYPGFYFYPIQSCVSRFNNYVTLSSNSNGFYLRQSSSLYNTTNYVNNTISGSLLFCHSSTQTFSNCIWKNNTGTLFSKGSATIIVSYSSIEHKGLWISGGMTIDQIIGESETYYLTHFQSDFCDFGPNLNQLESCLPMPTPHQTIPPLPTACAIISDGSNNVGTLTSMFHLLLLGIFTNFLAE